MSIVKLIGTIFLALIWISDGLLISFIQLLLYNFLRPINGRLFRKINYYLIYTSWSQIVAIAQYWSNCKIFVHFPDDDSKNKFAKEFNLTIMNHKYEVDWLFTWFAMDYGENLAAAKSYAKKALKHVPLIGWSFHFAEFIFLERSWEKDSKIMKQCLDNLKEYEDKITLLNFAEGTRFTKDKYEQSCKFAEERGIKPLKYHLIPRTRGFVYTVNHLKDHIKSLFNCHLEFETEGKYANKPTFTNIMKGKPMTGHMYLGRIPIETVPTGSDQELNDYLFKFYEKKDELTEEFLKTQTFATKYTIEIKPRLAPLLNLIFWVIFEIALFYTTIHLLVVYKYYTLLTTFIVIFALIGITALVLLVRSTKAQRGSTYGASSKAQDKKTS